jgi:MoaA/NifB/PqqE/SkfB family radical SAM enzyme
VDGRFKVFDKFEHQDPEGLLNSHCCKVPFNEFQIYRDGDVANCCVSWLPTYIGNIHVQSILEISKSEILRRIQNSVRGGDFKFCDSKVCPSLSSLLNERRKIWPIESKVDFDRIIEGELKKKFRLYLAFDPSCNLSCESCRVEKIFYDRSTAPSKLLSTYARLAEQVQELLDAGYLVDLNITGSGDAFASPLFYDFMCRLPQSDRIGLYISTNGTMMTEKKLNMPTKDLIRMILISVDSCIPESYAKIRRGGTFHHLQANLDALDRLVESKFLPSLHWQLNFIVQRDNYRELGDFVDWAKRFKTLKSIFFTKILDWGHLSSEIFNSKAVWKPDHPEYDLFLKQIQDVRLKSPNVILGNLSEYLKN